MGPVSSTEAATVAPRRAHGNQAGPKVMGPVSSTEAATVAPRRAHGNQAGPKPTLGHCGSRWPTPLGRRRPRILREVKDSGDLAETVAYVALRRLQNSYADIVTRQAWDELAGIVRADCPVVLDVRREQFTMTGPGELGEFIARQIERFELFHFVVLNTVMRIDADRGTAGARLYMHEIRQNVSDGRRTDAYGVNHDRFERDSDGRWWFARRHYRSFARTAEPRVAADCDVFDPPVIALDEI